MSRRWSLSLLLAAVPVLGSCTSYEALDLRPYLDQQQFPVSQGPMPADAEAVGFTVVQDTGFYLLGIAPLVPVSLDDCVHALVREARKVGGDGVAEVTIQYSPASLLNFTVILLPDWFATVKLTGCAWRRKR